MEPVDPSATSHPWVAVLDRLEAVVHDALQVPVFTLDAGAAAAGITRLVEVESRVVALKLALLAHGDAVDVAAPSGAASTATWLGHAVRATRAEAFRDTRLAASLADARHACVSQGLAEGRLRVEQARAIVDAVDRLPLTGESAITAEVVAQAEAHLVELAERHDAKQLRILGLRLLEVVSPETADAFEASRLEAQERCAAQQTRLTLSADGEGSVFIKGKIPRLHGAMLKKVLLAFAAPKHRAAVDGAGSERLPSPERTGRAFCELLESLAEGDLPRSGGTGATVVVTMDLATLTGGLRAAHLDTGEVVSPGQARRLACQAGLVPAVLDSASVPLDLGRTARFHTKAQRIAIGLRDGGCSAEGCDWPPGMCHVHHDPAWAAGGVTDLTHARMFCPHHHARSHDPAYDMTRLPDGSARFHRRT